MVEGPWYISASAVRDYIAIRRMRDPEGDGTFAVAEEELIEMAKDVLASGREPRRMDNGTLRYRGPRPHKLMLFVREEARPEGPLPQLVAVVAPGSTPKRREQR